MPAWHLAFLKPPSLRCLEFLCARSKTGNRVAESRQARQKTLFRVAERHPEVLQELAA
jgi:chorismate mutase